MSTGPNAGQVRGPVQLAFAKSVDRIYPTDISITRVCATNKDKTATCYEDYVESENKTEFDKLRTMGRKQFIPYGLYEARGFISANLAGETGFDEDDLKKLFEAVLNMYEHDRSASKGMMTVVSPLIIFKHVGTDSCEEQRVRQAKLGCTSAHKLFKLVNVKRKDGIEYARNIGDYSFTVDLDGCPKGIEIGFMTDPYGEISWNEIPTDCDISLTKANG